MTTRVATPIETPQAPPEEVESAAGKSQAAIVWERLRRKRLAMVSLVVIGVIYAAGIFAPLVAPYSYSAQDLERGLEGPSWDHPLGTDRLGRDLLSRAMYSARTTVIVTLAVVVTGGLLIGPALGLLSGYRGGWVDSVIMRVGEVFAGLPSLPMLILIAATTRGRVTDATRWVEETSGIGGLVELGVGSYIVVFGALSLFYWVGMARVVRAEVLALRERDFVVAAEAIGAGNRRIIFRHLLPNVMFLVILAVSGTLGAIAGSEIVLSWFGVGVQPPAPSFGQMLFEGSGARTFQAHPHLLLVPGIVVTLLLFAFNLLGDALNDAFAGR